MPSVTDTGPGLVTLHLWRVPAGRIGSALGRVAVDRFALRRQPGAGFSRLLGTGDGHTFRLRDAEPRRWRLLVALGVGERQVGLQGTFSMWESAAALRSFAYAGRAHAEVVRQTARQRWYAEELFAGFAVLDAAGTVDGRDPRRGPAW